MTERLWFMGGLTLIRADGELGVVAEHRGELGLATPLHVQPEDAEAFYVLDGTVIFEIAGERLDARQGAFVQIPAGTAHAFRIDSSHAWLLNLTTAQHGRFFREAGFPAPAGAHLPGPEPDMGRVMAAAAACNVQVVGPPLAA